jgi:lipid A disaccharide synthetase
MNDTYALLAHAKAALVTSGTATLETALHRVPQVVCYKGGLLSYYIGKMLIKVPYISLVNLICGKEVVAELIQQDFNENNLAKHLQQLLDEIEGGGDNYEYLNWIQSQIDTNAKQKEDFAKASPTVFKRRPKYFDESKSENSLDNEIIDDVDEFELDEEVEELLDKEV